ncbi:CcdC family protein [Cohnella sp. AR92]|uniref:CcdC family protein n=1 Tax=Cohnella sp. AR92 TaxID=648716 RepID=UPI000F8C8419|nr:cytochrome c biogenesis protein CcdC [Cohnella sp. AR92]RUS45112.1 cytochrome c biogenesis protein CcdC [Cohnella sp. AR92]
MNEANFYVILLAIAALVLWRRTRSMYRPIRSGARLLWPLLFTLPGISLIAQSGSTEPIWAFCAAFALGAALSLPLIWTTDFEVREDKQIYAKKNWGFIAAFVGLLILRIALREELSGLDAQDKTALFMTLAFGYLIPWRVVSFMKFQRVTKLKAQ